MMEMLGRLTALCRPASRRRTPLLRRCMVYTMMPTVYGDSSTILYEYWVLSLALSARCSAIDVIE